MFGEKAYPFLEVEAMAGSIDAKQALYRVDPVRRILSLMKLALQYGKDGNDERMKKLSGEAIFDLQSAMVYPGPYPPFPSNTYLFAASQEAAPTEILLEIVSTKGAIFRHDWRADNYEYSRARSILLQRLAGVSATQKSNEDIENDLFQGKIGKEQFLRAIANRHVEWLIQNAEISPNDYRPLKIEMLPDVCKVAPSALAKLQRAYASFLSSKNYGDLAHAVRAIAASGDEGEEFLARDLLIIRGEPGKIRPIQLGRLQVKLLDSPSPKLRDAAQVAVREWLAEIRENKPIQQNQFEDADRVELQGFLLLTLAAAGDQYAYAEMRTKRLSLLESYSAYSLNYGTWGPWHKSDAAKRELGERVQEVKTVIESGKPIPEELRWLLFKYPKEFGNAHDFYLHHVYREPQTDDDAYRTLSEMLALGIDCSKVLAMLLKRERATTLDLEGLYLRLSANDFRKLLPSLIKYMEENASSGSIAGLCLACYILHQNGADAKEAGPVLVRLARQGNKSLRMNALMALENVKSYSEESFAEIVRGVKSRDREIRKNAMRALLRFEDRAAIVFDDVAPLLKSDDSEERNAAASLLSSMGPPVAARAIEALQPFPEFGRQVEWLRSVN
ncbi:MAG: HEAT repeat domain-containing protein [Planctomycetes bacterium]|nr:HEAT repeat domain-containing protein [Planctomycetota bacterium]